MSSSDVVTGGEPDQVEVASTWHSGSSKLFC